LIDTAKANVNKYTRQNGGANAIHVAAAKGHADIVHYLIESDAFVGQFSARLNFYQGSYHDYQDSPEQRLKKRREALAQKEVRLSLEGNMEQVAQSDIGAVIWKALLDLNVSLQTCAKDDGALEDDEIRYRKRMDEAEEIRSKFEAQLREQGISACLVQHDVEEDTPLGLQISIPAGMPEDYAQIDSVAPAAADHGTLPEKVHPGMYLCAVGEFDCDDRSVVEIRAALKGLPRPVCLTFALPDLEAKVDHNRDGTAEELQIQSAMNALLSQVRDQMIEIKHLSYEMGERDKAISETAAQIKDVLQFVGGEKPMQKLVDDIAAAQAGKQTQDEAGKDAPREAPAAKGKQVWEKLKTLDAVLLQFSAADDGAMEKPVQVYKSRMAEAEELRVKFEDKLRKDGIAGCVVQHDLHAEGPLGIKISQEDKPEDYARITRINPSAAEHGNMTEKIFVGMYLCAVGGFDCDGKSVDEIDLAIQEAPHPVCITCAVPTLTEKVDKNGDGNPEQLQIQSAINALTTQLRDGRVQLSHLQHEMTEWDQTLDDNAAKIASILQLVGSADGSDDA